MKYHSGVPTAFRRWLPSASLVLLPSLIALALYGPELTLPYYWDDYPHFNFVTTRSYWSLWTSAAGLPYFRPLTLTIDKLFFNLLPFGASLLPHLGVVLGHVLAAILAGYVAGVLWLGPERTAKAGQAGGRAAVAIITAGLFAAFPFATQSVAYLGAATHMWLADLTLAGLAALLHYAQGGGRAFAGLALVMALVAPTAHEAGVMAGPLMVAGLGRTTGRFRGGTCGCWWRWWPPAPSFCRSGCACRRVATPMRRRGRWATARRFWPSCLSSCKPPVIRFSPWPRCGSPG